MNKKYFAIIFVGAIISVGCSVFFMQRGREMMVQGHGSDKVVDNDGVHIDVGNFDMNGDTTSDWQTYRNDEYGFEIKYPGNGWVVEESLIQNKSSFFVKKKDSKKVFFGIFPKGGFGHGLEDVNETKDLFGGKEARLLWLKKHNIPKYIYIIKDYPKNWTDENLIEISGLDGEKDVLTEMYKSFVFLEASVNISKWKTYQNENNGVSLKIPPYSTYKSENDSLIFYLVDKSISERLKVDFSEQDPAWWNDSNREHSGYIEKIFNGLVNGYQVSYYETYTSVINSEDKISNNKIILIAIIHVDENEYVKIEFSGHDVEIMKKNMDIIVSNIHVIDQVL